MNDDLRKIRLELLDGTLEATGSEDFLRRAQRFFALLAAGEEPPAERVPDVPAFAALSANEVASVTKDKHKDIRSLADEKQPKSAIEMAALVAYYVTELAPDELRKDAISADDLKQYFGQAAYRSSSPPRIILSNAKAAGYLDNPSHGQYKLNPVGFNLVTAGLPSTGAAQRKPRRAPLRKASKKATQRKRK